MSSRHLPLGRHPAIRTHSVDETRERFACLGMPMAIEQMPRRSFAWEGNRAPLGPLTLWAHGFADGFSATTESGICDTVVVSIPIGTSTRELRSDREPVTLVPRRTGSVSTCLERLEMRTGDGFRSANVYLPAAAIAEAVRTLEGVEAKRPIRFAPSFDLTSPATRSFLGTLIHAFSVADVLDDEAGPIGARIAEALLFDLLVSMPREDDRGASDAVPSGTPRHIRRAMDYLDTHATRPVRMTEVAEAAGTSVRNLQHAFLANRGCSPMDFLRARRLTHARRQLLSDDPVSIAQVALASGFTHLGRFSVLYRETFGELPTETRARATGPALRAARELLRDVPDARN